MNCNVVRLCLLRLCIYLVMFISQSLQSITPCMFIWQVKINYIILALALTSLVLIKSHDGYGHLVPLYIFRLQLSSAVSLWGCDRSDIFCHIPWMEIQRWCISGQWTTRQSYFILQSQVFKKICIYARVSSMYIL